MYNGKVPAGETHTQSRGAGDRRESFPSVVSHAIPSDAIWETTNVRGQRTCQAHPATGPAQRPSMGPVPNLTPGKRNLPRIFPKTQAPGLSVPHAPPQQQWSPGTEGRGGSR